jgi:hypothetical protein
MPAERLFKEPTMQDRLLTDYEAMQKMFATRCCVDFACARLDRDGFDHRTITLDLGQRHAWCFEFDEQGKLVRSEPDCY